MNDLTENELITLRHVADRKHYDGSPNVLTAAQYIASLDSLESRDMVKVAWCEGHSSYDDIWLLTKGQAALDDYRFEKQQQILPFGYVTAEAKQNHRNRMEALVALIDEEEYKVLKFLYDTKKVKCDFTDKVPKGMYQPDYEKICDSLKEKGLVDIKNFNIRGYYVISTVKGDDLIEYIEKNDTKFHPAKYNEGDTTTTSCHDKVRLEMTLRLLENGGLDLAKHGNKAKTARILQKITGLPLSTCKNYCTNRDLSHEVHKSEISDINKELNILGLNICI